MSWRTSNDAQQRRRTDGALITAAATLLLLLLVTNWAVPCAGQCTAYSSALASLPYVAQTNFVPSIAQRLKVGDDSVIVSSVTVTLSSSVATGTVWASIHNDEAGLLGSLVSDVYVGMVTTTYSVFSPYTITFTGGLPPLAANSFYWIVFSSTEAFKAQWGTASVATPTSAQYMNLNFGVASNSVGSIPAAAASDYSWTAMAAGTTLALTVNGCADSNHNRHCHIDGDGDCFERSRTYDQRYAYADCNQVSEPECNHDLASNRTPRASASATPAVVVVVVLTPITANVTSSFDSTQTALNLTAPATTNGTSGVTQPGVTVVSQFSEVRVANRTLPPPAIQELTVSNDTSTNATTYTYSSSLDNATSVEQAFTFFDQKTSGNFSGLTFDIGASSVKWSIHLLATGSSSSDANSTAGGGLTLRYRLTGLMVGNSSMSSGSNDSVVASRGQVVVQRGRPQANMTTYIVPLFTTTTTTSTTTTSTTAAQVELFDVALIDGTRFVPIGHSIVRTASVDNEANAEYVVELVLPGFNESLFYDPTIGLGVLLGRNDRDGNDGGSSSSNMGLIVGVAVAVPVAVALVLLVIGAALAIAWRQKQLARRNAESINFGASDDHDHDHDQL